MSTSEIEALRALINEIAGTLVPQSNEVSELRSYLDVHGGTISQLLALADAGQAS